MSTDAAKQLSETMDIVRIPASIPYTLTPEEESRAISDKEQRLREHTRWTLLTKGLTPREADSIIDAKDWSAEYDRESVLTSANRMKHFTLIDRDIRKKRHERLLADKKALLDSWDARRMYEYLCERSRANNRKLEVTEDNTKLIKVLCFRLSDDLRFATELNLDPGKGILLHGDPGIGKSYLVECLADNGRHPIVIHSMIEIAQSVRSQGYYPARMLDAHEFQCIDDVGTEYDKEDKIKHYGSDVNWFKNFIENYYTKGRGQYFKLIISTNDSFDKLQQKYGFRVRSRLAEMFNIINVTGADMRKKSINHI